MNIAGSLLLLTVERLSLCSYLCRVEVRVGGRGF